MKRLDLCRILVVMLCLLAVQGCSSDDYEETQIEQPVEELYNQAQDLMTQKSYIEAAKLFVEVERQHPYSKWATQAQLMAAFAYYRELRYDDALLALDRFIQLHPGNEKIAYAYYLRALCYYEQISDVRRDQKMTELALDALKTVIRRFPDSEYARDAGLKLDLTYDHLAGKEIEIGRYYLTRGHYQASINRFKKVVTDYQTTSQVPEALHRLVEAYMAIGIESEAYRVGAVLGYNYPGSKWYEATYSLLDKDRLQARLNDRSWVDRAVDTIFRPE